MSDAPEKKSKKKGPPLPGYSEETPVHRLLGRAFAKLGHERAPAYPGDKKDENLAKEELGAGEREAPIYEAKERKRRKPKKPRPPEDFYISP